MKFVVSSAFHGVSLHFGARSNNLFIYIQRRPCRTKINESQGIRIFKKWNGQEKCDPCCVLRELSFLFCYYGENRTYAFTMAEETARPPQKQYDYLLKFLLVGDSDVGKQEILSELDDGASESPFCSGSGKCTYWIHISLVVRVPCI